MALSAEPPVVTDVLEDRDAHPGAAADFVPSIHWPVPWPLRFLAHIERRQRPTRDEAQRRHGRGERVGAHRDAADGLDVGSALGEQPPEARGHEEVALGREHRLLAVDVEVALRARRQRDLALLVRELGQQRQEALSVLLETRSSPMLIDVFLS